MRADLALFVSVNFAILRAMPLNSRHRIALVSVAISVLIVIIYWPALQSEFINFDDPDYVTENRVVQRGLTAEGLKWAFGRLHGEQTYWHPLTWVSHMVDCQLFGLNSAWHHAINILFHMANSVLLLLFLNNLTGAFWRSAAVAAIFAVHPLALESVAWVTERKNLLSTFFLLLASVAYARFARTKRRGPYLSCLILFACALMSKPAVVVLPFVFLLLDFWPLQRFSLSSPWRERGRSAALLLFEKLPFLALSVASAAVTIVAHDRIGIRAAGHELPLLYRIQNALVSYGQYLKKIFFPFDLGIMYPHPRVWPTDTVLIASLALIVVTVVALACLKKRPYLGVGWFWFLGVLIPAIGIIQVGYQAMADRFAYVPMIGVLIMAVWAGADLLSTLRAKPVVIGMLCAAALVYFAGGTATQLRHWKDSETVFRRALDVTKSNYIAHINLGVALFKKGKTDEAESQARQALQVHDKDQLPYLLLGSINNQKSDFTAAVSNYGRALELNPHAISTRYLLARALLNSGQSAQAKEHFQALTQAGPYQGEAHAFLAQIFMAEKNAPAAIQQYRQVLRMQPEWPTGMNDLAWLLATNPDPQVRNGTEAVRLGERACELTRYEEPLFIGTLAAAYAEAGRYADAVATAKRARALALEKGLTELAQRNAELLKVYAAGQAFHEGP